MLKILMLLIVLTLSGSLGGFCFKKAVSSCDSLIRVVFSPLLYLGGIFYVTGAALNIVVLKFLPYTVVLPLTALTYIWTLIIAHFALKEKITRLKITGVILILAGAILLCVKVPL
ncbi:MAG: EamA family transporter [Solirubrobacterales bacterium]